MHMLATKYATVNYQGIPSEFPYNYEPTTTLWLIIRVAIM